MDISFSIYTGEEIKNYITTLSQFRKDAFSLPPYSYCFDQNTEDEYMKQYVSNKSSCLICAIRKNKIIGLASGMPLSPCSIITEKAVTLFKENNLNSNKFFYVCEVIVLQKYRGCRIGETLMKKMEEYSRRIGLTCSCLLTEITFKNSKNNLWRRMKYSITEMIETYTWPTYIKDNVVENKEHRLVYWIKKNV